MAVSAPPVYETLNGQAIPYRGYEQVLNGEQETESIMGSSLLQSLVITAILRYLYQVLPADYEAVTNETGLHLDKNNNLAADIAIFSIQQLAAEPLTNQYATLPPKVVIEVDTKASLNEVGSEYYLLKTQRLLDFGVERLIWVYPQVKRILIAEPLSDWSLVPWDKTVTLIDDVTVSIGKLVDQRLALYRGF